MRKVKSIIGKKFKESTYILGNLLAISIKLIKLPMLGLTFDESVINQCGGNKSGDIVKFPKVQWHQFTELQSH